MRTSRPRDTGLRASASARRGRTVGSSRTVSASFAAKNFGALVDAVREERAVYVVERAGQPVVHVVPAVRSRPTLGDLVQFLRESGRLDEAYLSDVERGVAFLNRPVVPGDPWGS